MMKGPDKEIIENLYKRPCLHMKATGWRVAELIA